MDKQNLIEECLAAFVRAGSIELSLDQLASQVGTSKRMLIHYFGSRDQLETSAISLLEDRLRSRFAPEAFPTRISPNRLIEALWSQSTAPEAKNILLLTMDISRRAWNGSERANKFFADQQKLWTDLLVRHLQDRTVAASILQLFQGALMNYLISGDPEPGRRALLHFLKRSLNPRRKIGIFASGDPQ